MNDRVRAPLDRVGRGRVATEPLRPLPLAAQALAGQAGRLVGRLPCLPLAAAALELRAHLAAGASAPPVPRR